MTVEKLRQLTLLQAVLLRPKMYTVHGTLSELLSFFYGCVDSSAGETRDDGSIRVFFEWLATSLEFDPQLIIPSRIFDSAIQHFGSEASAISTIRAQFLDVDDRSYLKGSNARQN